MESSAVDPILVTGGDESVECEINTDGIVIYSLSPTRIRQFSMPWPWLIEVRRSIDGA
jgi:hypothetical protein